MKNKKKRIRAVSRADTFFDVPQKFVTFLDIFPVVLPFLCNTGLNDIFLMH